MNVEACDGIPVMSCEEGERPEDPCTDYVSPCAVLCQESHCHSNSLALL